MSQLSCTSVTQSPRRPYMLWFNIKRQHNTAVLRGTASLKLYAVHEHLRSWVCACLYEVFTSQMNGRNVSWKLDSSDALCFIIFVTLQLCFFFWSLNPNYFHFLSQLFYFFMREHRASLHTCNAFCLTNRPIITPEIPRWLVCEQCNKDNIIMWAVIFQPVTAESSPTVRNQASPPDTSQFSAHVLLCISPVCFMSSANFLCYSTLSYPHLPSPSSLSYPENTVFTSSPLLPPLVYPCHFIECLLIKVVMSCNVFMDKNMIIVHCLRNSCYEWCQQILIK